MGRVVQGGMVLHEAPTREYTIFSFSPLALTLWKFFLPSPFASHISLRAAPLLAPFPSRPPLLLAPPPSHLPLLLAAYHTSFRHLSPPCRALFPLPRVLCKRALPTSPASCIQARGIFASYVLSSRRRSDTSQPTHALPSLRCAAALGRSRALSCTRLGKMGIDV